MSIIYPQSPEDSARYLAERNQPVGDMVQMRQTIERQAAEIKRLTSDRDRYRNLLVDLGMHEDIIDPPKPAGRRANA